MNYRVRREGVELGAFPIEELRRRRETGELTGREYVLGEGRKDWQPLDFFLRHGEIPVPPIPQGRPAARGGSPALFWVIVVAVFLVFATWIGFVVFTATRVMNRLNLQKGVVKAHATSLASKPVHWTTNTLTEADVLRDNVQLSRRVFVEPYAQVGHHDPRWDTLVTNMFDAWLNQLSYPRSRANTDRIRSSADQVARSGCDDPIALGLSGIVCDEFYEKNRRLDRALKLFENSSYQAYPKFVTTVYSSSARESLGYSVTNSDAKALDFLRQSFKDGSTQPRDQSHLAEVFLNRWGIDFFKRNSAAVTGIVKDAGKDYQWLALVLEGQGRIADAWKARGNGFANAVTSQGWKDFHSDLAQAHSALEKAWNLRPDLPQAPARMIEVAMGESSFTDMRKWFDRAVTAQIDYREAWSSMRWGLRPRWFGDEDAMLAFGIMAARTARFDTDVPHILVYSIADIEQEEKLEPGRHIFSREDVWPEMQAMYDGYIAHPGTAEDAKYWRSLYAITAYFAEKYDVAGAQYQALSWEPQPTSLENWQVDCSLVPLEVAARMGAAGEKVARAEARRSEGDNTTAMSLYREVAQSTLADTHTLEFVRSRLASLEIEQHLDTGEWVDFLPKNDHDPNWSFALGETRVLPDGALEVTSDPRGHFLYSRVRVGSAFEVRGSFEVMHSSTKSFQAGLVMGMTDFGGRDWNAFRIKRNQDENDIASFSHRWERTGVSKPIKLNDTTNSFDFSFEDSRATASVNGKEVLHDAKEARKLKLCEDCNLLGIGAFNDANDTVIRYRNLQVRRLGAVSPASKKR